MYSGLAKTFNLHLDLPRGQSKKKCYNFLFCSEGTRTPVKTFNLHLDLPLGQRTPTHLSIKCHKKSTLGMLRSVIRSSIMGTYLMAYTAYKGLRSMQLF